MQPLLGRFEPGLEPMAFPALRFDQYDPRRLHEQDPQVAITSLRYLAKDRAIAGRHLGRTPPNPLTGCTKRHELGRLRNMVPLRFHPWGIQ